MALNTGYTQGHAPDLDCTKHEVSNKTRTFMKVTHSYDTKGVLKYYTVATPTKQSSVQSRNSFLGPRTKGMTMTSLLKALFSVA